MILTKSYRGGDIWIDASMVMSISRRDAGTTLVAMACGNESEEWILSESIETLRPKIEHEKEKR